MKLKSISKDNKTALASDGTKLKFVAPRLVDWAKPCKNCYLANRTLTGGSKRCFGPNTCGKFQIVLDNHCCPQSRVDHKLGHWRKRV